MTEGKSNSASVKCSNTDDDPTDEASPQLSQMMNRVQGKTLKNQSLPKSLRVIAEPLSKDHLNPEAEDKPQILQK